MTDKNEAIRLLEEHSSLLKEILKKLSNQGSELSKTQDPSEIPTIESVEKFANEIGAPSFLAANFYYDKEAVGWRHNGQPIVNWRAMFRKYVLLHDQKQERETSTGAATSKMDDTTRQEMQRCRHIKADRAVWRESGCPE